MAEQVAPIVGAALRYFAAVFAAGFALGVVRVGWLVPRLGERAAELTEIPVMLAVIVFVARRIVRRYQAQLGTGGLSASGLLALLLLLAAEVALVLAQDRSIGEYLAGRDPVAGLAYAASLVVYATLPGLLARHAGRANTGA